MAASGAVLVPIGLLRPGYSRRLLGEYAEHVQRLAESTTPLPPIVVHRVSMQVIDGMHRLRAAVVRGEEEMWVEYFDGDETMAFVVAVRKNIAHGLPLTAADRADAASGLLCWAARTMLVITILAAASACTLGILLSSLVVLPEVVLEALIYPVFMLGGSAGPSRPPAG